jgi:hypothetical protein
VISSYHITPRKQTNLISMIALSLSIIVLALVIVYVLITVSMMRKDIITVSAAMPSLKDEYKSDLARNDALDGAAIDALKKQNYETITAMQRDIMDINMQLDKITALQSDVEKLKTPAADPKFNVTSFNLAYFSDNSDFEYQSYSGVGIISADNLKDSFFALLKKTLKSGGAPTTPKVEYLTILVVNGTGTFETDDSVAGPMVKPVYEFEIIGYARIIMNG